MDALKRNQTWDIVELPKEKTMECKWVYALKYKTDSSLERYKVGLVAKRFAQIFGIDYQEIFDPIAKMNTIRILFFYLLILDGVYSNMMLKMFFYIEN